MSLDHAILGLLAERPRSGYDLKTRCFDGAMAPFWSADQAQIYRTLGRLREQRLVASSRKRQSGKPDRLLYRTTTSGLDALDDWLRASPVASSTRDPFLVRLYFGASLTDEELLEVLVTERERRQSALEALRSGAAATAADDGLDDRTSTLRQTAFEGAITRERATIDWLDDCIEAVREGALPGSDGGGIGQRHLFGS